MMTRFLAFLRLSCAFLLSCAPTETGNPPFMASLAFDAHSTDDTVGFDATDRIVVDEIWIDVGPTRFVLDDECASPETDLFAAELGVEDHVTDTAVRTDFMLEEASYCRVSVPLRVVESLPVGAPAELMGNALYLRGSADGVPFTLVSSGPYDIELTGAPLPMSEAERGVLVGFDVGAWLGALDFAGAERTGGTIVIDPSNNSSVLAAFEAALTSGVALYRDIEVDGFIDPTPPVLTAD